MRHLFTATLAMLLISGATFAQDCGDCTDCDPAGCQECGFDKAVKNTPAKAALKAAPAAKISATIAKLEASSAKGCKTSAQKLTMLQKTCGADDLATLKEKVAAYEKYCDKGCTVSSKMLVKMQADLAGPKKAARARLSERVPAYRLQSLKPLFAASGMKDRALLVAYVRNLEAKGCGGCLKKIASLDALLANAKPALSARLAKLAAGEKAGCDKSAAMLKPLNATCGTDGAKTLLAQVQAWEAKADGGCAKCEAKLTDLETKLVTAAAKLTCGAGCRDCDGADCAGCDKAAKTGVTAAPAKAAAKTTDKAACAGCDKAKCTDCSGANCPGCPKAGTAKKTDG